jgi:ribose-phosphate pyrophosphokinase
LNGRAVLNVPVPENWMILQKSPPPLLFAPSESHALAAAAAEAANLELASLEERQYDGGEFKLRPLQSVRDRTVFALQSLSGTAGAPIERRLIRLLFLLQGLRDAGANRTIAVIPYLAFARKDRRTKPRDPVYTRYVAQLLEVAGADRVIAVYVHNASAFDNSFRVPTVHLSALPMLAAHFIRQTAAGKLAVASPDIGGIKRAQLFRELLERTLSQEVELVFIEKSRSGGVVKSGAVVGNVVGRTTIVVDDLCATGTTLVRAAASLRAAGASSIHVAVTHTPLEAGLAELASANDIAEVVVTDSVGYAAHSKVPAQHSGKISVLPIGPLLGHAMARMAQGEPLTALLEEWPVSAS